MKRGRWAGHVKKVRASANGTSNLRPRVVAAAAKPAHATDGITAALVFHGGGIGGGGGGGSANGVLRTFTALFDALGAAEKGLPPKRAEDPAAVAAVAIEVAGAGMHRQGCAAEQGFQLFTSKWLQAGGQFPRIISIRPDLFCSVGGSLTASLPLPAVPLFR